MKIELPKWMVHKIVHILSERPYNEVSQIIEAVKEQVEEES